MLNISVGEDATSKTLETSNHLKAVTNLNITLLERGPQSQFVRGSNGGQEGRLFDQGERCWRA